MGTQMFELDCHLTRDMQVVVSHDNNLERATGVEGLVSDFNYEDLPPLRSSLRPDFDYNHVTLGQEDRRIPLLRDVFEQFPNMPVNVDIKINNDDLIREVNKLVVEFKREDLTVWGNGSKEVTDKCHKMNPDIGLLFSMKRVVKVVLLFYAGLLPFIPLHETHYEVLMPSTLLKEGRFRISPSKKMRFLLRLADILLMNSSIFRHLNKRGIQTYLWVINDESDFQRAFSYGVNGVMTDFPARLREFLDANPHFERQTEL